MDLAQCIPTGKSGKGVRAARNQALRAGVITEEVSGEQIRVEKKIQDEMRAVLAQWKSRNLFEMGGFLNTVNPFLRMEDRRYFLSRDRNGRLDGYLVATPIPRKKSFFLEDLVLRKNSSRGSGELLMLEGMAALAEAGGVTRRGGKAGSQAIARGGHAIPTHRPGSDQAH